MDTQHQLLKVNPPQDTPYKKHSATLKIVATLKAKTRLKGEPEEKNLLADVVIYRNFIP